MTTPDSDYCQRWKEGRHTWRHKSEGGFDSSCYEVALVGEDRPCKTFVEAHHYSRAYPAARIRVGLFNAGALTGVAVFGVPMQRSVLTNPFPSLEPYDESLELSRFVLLDEVPANAETWFLAQAFRLCAGEGLRGVVAFADPVSRTLSDGTVLSPGHVGTIYQASNGWHTETRGKARTLLMCPDGRVFSERALSKIRNQERGHEYAERRLVTYGARPLRPGESPASWLVDALNDAGVQRVRHPGNYRYLFRLGNRAERSRVVFGMSSAPYPKKELIAA